jgi:branched-chain amino acid transport system substrate-binding protein
VPQGLSIKRNATIGKAEVDALLAQQPEVLLNTVLSGAAAQVQKELVERGRMLPTSSLSFVGGDQYAKAVGEAGAGVSIAQVVPNPTASIPVVRECAKALETAGSKTLMNTTQLEACLGAKVLTEAIRRAKKPVSAKSVLEALTNLGTYDLGGFTVEFNAADHHGSSFVELARVSKDGRLLTR